LGELTPAGTVRMTSFHYVTVDARLLQQLDADSWAGVSLMLMSTHRVIAPAAAAAAADP